MTVKLSWQGRLRAVQPRIRLLRSFDEVSHAYPGFVLRIDGFIGNDEREFTVAIGNAAQQKHGFKAGDAVKGVAVPVEVPEKEPAEYYKASGLKVLAASAVVWEPPPWLGAPPDLATYRARGHRRLDPEAFAASCTACIWGADMAVEMVVDQWNPSEVQYRRETFCYGPKSCPHYRAGGNRKVPGRRGMIHVEPDEVDADATAHRGPDD